MAPASLKLTIPEPCSERWSEMHVQQGGRFCSSCEKVVVDFSQFTDQQLVAYFSNPPAKVCGRFTGKQLNHQLLPAQKPAERYWPKAAAGIALWLGISSQVQAQQQLMGKPILPESHETINQASSETNEERLENAPATNLEIIGVLMDEVTREPVPFGNVIIKGTKHYAQTDIEGRFKFFLPADSVAEKIILYTQNVGYESGEFTFPKAVFLAGVEVSLELKHSVQMLSGMVVVTRVSRWQRVKNFFRFRSNGIKSED